MFAIPPNGYETEENLVGKRHCILVSVTNPFPLPKPVYRPNFDGCGDPSPTYDVDDVAGWFGRCSVSLSVICPWNSPKITALYEAGKRNHGSENPPVQNLHPNYLVRISEDFKEAQVALYPTEVAAYQDSFPSHRNSEASTAYLPVSQPASNSLHLSFGNITPTSLEREVAAICFSTPDYCPSPICFIDTYDTEDSEDDASMSGCQTSLPIMVPHDLVINDEDLELLLADMPPPSLLAILYGAEYVLHVQENSLAAFQDIASSGLLTGNYSPGIISSETSFNNPISQTALSSENPSSSMVSGFEAVTGASQAITNSAVNFKSATNFQSNFSSLGCSQSLSSKKVSTTVITRPTESSLDQVKSSQLEDSLGMNSTTSQNVSTIVTASSAQSALLELPQQSNYSTISKTVSQENPGSEPKTHYKYIKVWEGTLLVLRERHFQSISKLEAYRRTLSPEMLGADLPDCIRIVRLILLERIKPEYNFRRSELLFFKVLEEHLFFNQLFEKKLCAVASLPSHLLILSASDRPMRLIGMYLPKNARTASLLAAARAGAASSSAASGLQQG